MKNTTNIANAKNMTTILEIVNSCVRETSRITSYEHIGNHTFTDEIIHQVIKKVKDAVNTGTLRTDDLTFKIWYYGNDGNAKLRNIAYTGGHPELDCCLDGFGGNCSSCTGKKSLLHTGKKTPGTGWCYVYNGRGYRSFGKTIPMIVNSVLLYLDPKRAESQILDWLKNNASKITKDLRGNKHFRIDETGDIKYCLDIWERVADAYPDITFYGYTKQFEFLEKYSKEHGIVHKNHPNLIIRLSNSTADDPNPPTQYLLDNYCSYGINFKQEDKTPQIILDIANSVAAKKAKCPGTKVGCHSCGKCMNLPGKGFDHLYADQI